jgi:hypothetical protein
VGAGKRRDDQVSFIPEDYVPVADRLARFRAERPTWALAADLIVDDGKRVLARASICDDHGRLLAVGHAEEIRGQGNVNRTSAVENAETSAWGRALAALGYEVRAGIASREEVEKTSRQSGPREMSGSAGGKGKAAAGPDGNPGVSAVGPAVGTPGSTPPRANGGRVRGREPAGAGKRRAPAPQDSESLKLFRAVAEDHRMDGAALVAKLRSLGWDIPDPWWPAVAGWPVERVGEADRALHTDPERAPRSMADMAMEVGG